MKPDLYPALPLLIVDDEAALVRSYDNTLRDAGINNIVKCTDSRDAEGIIASESVCAVVLDLLMPHVSGREILSKIVKSNPEIPVIIVTAAGEVETAVDCMKEGAFDYFVKPIDSHRLITGVRRAIELRELRSENTRLRQHLLEGKLENPQAFSAIVTGHESMFALFRYVESVAESSQPVLITGETGVGKELIAEALHKLSGRPGKFVAVNTAGLDDTVFSDTFFGHVRGAFTSADGARAGLAETAQDGTLFMDEIGDLNATSQMKLLRFVQDGEYFPLGSDKPQKSNARVVASTNRDIRRLVETGSFREDLFFRLLSHHIRVPPLRERMSDLPMLVEHFLEEAAAATGKRKPTAPRELTMYLSSYAFPGNIRELKAMVYDAVSSHKSGVLSLSTFIGRIGPKDDLPLKPAVPGGVASDSIEFPARLPSWEQAMLMLVREALTRTGNNQTAAAQILGISRQSLNKYSRILAGSGEKQSSSSPHDP